MNGGIFTRFFDANLTYGISVMPGIPSYPGMRTISDIDAALVRAGAAGGLIHQLAADLVGVRTGNQLLADDLPRASTELYGMYTIVPSCCGELPKADDLPGVMRQQKMLAIRFVPAVPGLPGFVARPAVLGDYLAVAQDMHIPVVLDTTIGLSIEQAWDYMEAFPNLTAILGYKHSWPSDRVFRPFLEHFPNLLMELSSMMSDQGIERLTKDYGANRLLYASRYPSHYMGGAMLMLRAADIAEEEKALIAGENFMRLTRWMR